MEEDLINTRITKDTENQRIYKFISPIKIVLPKKRVKDETIYLNLNTYRNIHWIKNNKTKQIYNEIMKDQLEGLKINPPIDIDFILYANAKKDGKKIFDTANICCIINKFFCDALVHYSCIEDDSYKYIEKTSSEFGGYDMENPRVEIILKETYATKNKEIKNQ